METTEAGICDQNLSNNFRIRSIEKSPLQIEELLANILEFLDPETVKECRLVCTVWDREGRRNLLKNDRVTLCVPDDLHTIPSVSCDAAQNLKCGLQSLLSNSSALEPVRLRIRNQNDVEIFLNENRLLNEKVTSLDFDGPSSSSSSIVSKMDTEQLAQILDKLTNLKILDTICLDLSPDQVWLQESSRSGEEDLEENGVVAATHNSKFKKFIDKLSSLDKIGLNFWLNLSTFRNFVDHTHAPGDQLRGVKSVRICSEPVLTLFVTEVNNLQWKIERLRLMIHNEMPIFVVRHFLRSVSPHLRHLRLSFFFRFQQPPDQAQEEEVVAPVMAEIDLNQPPIQIEDQIEQPVQNNGQPIQIDPPIQHNAPPLMSHSHIPWTLTNLETLDIYADDDRLESSVWKTVAVALRLPQLKKLVIRSSITNAFDEMIRQWTQHYPLRPIRSESLQKLVLWPRTMLQSSTILFSDCWPNLVSLVVKLEINEEVTGSAFLAIFTQLSSIKRLDLFLTDEHPPSGGQGSAGSGLMSRTNFDELLVGVERPEEYVGGAMLSIEQMERSQFRSIRSLQSLKCLKLECVFCCEVHGWTDFFIYHGLLHLRALQSVEMSKKFISEKAIQDLRAEFGPSVHIYFYEDEMF